MNAMDCDPNRTARLAGLLYLIVVLTGFFNLMYVPQQLFVDADSAATASAILASLPLFKLGIIAGILCYLAFLLLPLALYRLLAAHGTWAATLMVAFAVTSVPISLYNLTHRLEVLTLLGDAHYLAAFSQADLYARMELALDAYRAGLQISEVFWGLWLLPLGLLIWRSRLVPRVLGALLIAGGIGYLIQMMGGVLAPEFRGSTLASIGTLPAGLGEIGTCLWLLIRGAPAGFQRAA